MRNQQAHGRIFVTDDQVMKNGTKSTSRKNIASEPAIPYGKPQAKVIPFPAPQDAYSTIQLIRKGLPMASVTALMQIMETSLGEMAGLLHTSERTLRRYEAQTVLNPEQTERILELQMLFNRGTEVLGSAAAFRRWAGAQLPALGGQAPQSLMDTSTGIGLLMDTLGRIEHGVFA